MKIVKVIWDWRNRKHFAEHERVSERTVEFVLQGRRAPLWTVGFHTTEEGEERRLFLGVTPAGRYLIVVTEVVGPGEVRPITRYYASNRAIRDYTAWVNKVKKSLQRQAYKNPSNAKPEWPINGRIPRFASMVEEARFWKQWSFDKAMDLAGEQAFYRPSAGTTKTKRR